MDVREHNIRGSTELRESYMDLNDLFSFSWLGGRKRLCLNVSSSGFIRISDPVPEGGGGGGCQVLRRSLLLSGHGYAGK